MALPNVRFLQPHLQTHLSYDLDKISEECWSPFVGDDGSCQVAQNVWARCLYGIEVTREIERTDVCMHGHWDKYNSFILLICNINVFIQLQQTVYEALAKTVRHFLWKFWLHHTSGAFKRFWLHHNTAAFKRCCFAALHRHKVCIPPSNRTHQVWCLAIQSGVCLRWMLPAPIANEHDVIYWDSDCC